MTRIDPPGEMWCDRCDKHYPCHLQEYRMGSRFCECGGRWQWTPPDVPDDWET